MTLSCPTLGLIPWSKGSWPVTKRPAIERPAIVGPQTIASARGRPISRRPALRRPAFRSRPDVEKIEESIAPTLTRAGFEHFPVVLALIYHGMTKGQLRRMKFLIPIRRYFLHPCRALLQQHGGGRKPHGLQPR
jgi:hypothetical protein